MFLRPSFCRLRALHFVTLSSLGASAVIVVGCASGPTEAPKSRDPGMAVGGVPGSTTSAPSIASSKIPDPVDRSRARGAGSASPVAEEKPRRPDEDPALGAPLAEAGPDPMNGSFTLAQAAAGLAASGAFVATIKTSKGDMRCKLMEDKAPIAVANFVGLARGIRPFKDKGEWVKRPAYDGTSFHRVIKGFMIQGGDPQGTGRGEPGYTFKDELWMGGKHDRAGLLCMANRGPDTNGMQFFITDASAPHLDKSYTIFGECSPVSVVHAIANVPTESSDRPEKEVRIEKVEITRGLSAPAPKDPPKPSTP